MPDCKGDAARLHRLHTRPSLGFDRLAGTAIALGQAVLIVDPNRVACMLGELIVRIDNAKALVERPHGIVHLVAKGLPQTQMVLKRRC